MDGVGKGDAGIVARPFKAAELAAQKLYAAESAVLNGLSNVPALRKLGSRIRRFAGSDSRGGPNNP